MNQKTRHILPLSAFALACAVASTIVACEPENVVRLAPAPRADSLVFLIGNAATPGAPTTYAYGLSVTPCGSEAAVWTIDADGTRTMPQRVLYGQRVPGYITRHPAEPLTPGCYRVLVSGSAPATFTVMQSGQIVPH